MQIQQDGIYVWGGVFADGSFSELETGADEQLSGPFPDGTAAAKACLEGIRRNVDICWHRLFVLTGAQVDARRAARAVPG